MQKVAFYHANYNSIIKNGVTEFVFELLALKAKIKGVFSRPYCCYGNLLCHKINSNLFPDDWAVYCYHDVGVNRYRVVVMTHQTLRVRFLKKIQDWILKSEIIRKRILRFFTQQINPRSFGSRCLKGAEESTLGVDSSVPLIHHDPRDLGLICLVKKRKIRFRILSEFKNPILDFFKETHPKS